ncbi:MAG: glutamate--cysteine ligase [Verrucomicrobiae bacterium]|nr:glutamate--cysteine ligase [Verrucomicrobiae bacterium]
MAAPFSQFGIELETMIVDRSSLNPRPIADRILFDNESTVVNSVRKGPITWSNELVMHVIEFKTSTPVRQFDGLVSDFHTSMLEADRLLEAHGAGLLGTATHPWFDPSSGVSLWLHDDREIYETFDRIFGCKGHGWSNLQSFHINLPFDVGNDDAFRRLHSAIRLALPLVPVLAASSPIMDGKVSPFLDARLEAYAANCIRVPSITGGLIPDVYESQDAYAEKVYRLIAHDLEELDPEGILEPEWTNARGAIARFDRGSIEIRVGDVQECPRQDLAIIRFLIHLIQDWYSEKRVSLADQEAVPTSALKAFFKAAVKQGRSAPVTDANLLRVYGVKEPETAGAVLKAMLPSNEEWTADIRHILTDGNLAERILHAVGPQPAHQDLERVFRQLRSCLLENRAFVYAADHQL